ncbi:thiaminase (transcriptional activator TenA) [Eubacterium ruminantium]|nr:thiaminase (transcriptional activator TenA) [Eubacterium ruminantium]
MKLSDILYKAAEDMWAEAAEKPFVIDMAEGTLDEKRFCNYMIQDYLYLLDYIDILKKARTLSESDELISFLDAVIEEVEKETFAVHVPAMNRLGINGAEIDADKRPDVILEYVAFMRSSMEEYGILAALTALLQCSWNYAFLGQVMVETYGKEIAVSPYKFWFDAYTCDGYKNANQLWIDTLNKETKDIQSEEAEKLTRLFVTCAGYENAFWDALYKKEF